MGMKIDYNILMSLRTALPRDWNLCGDFKEGDLGMSEGNKALVRRLIDEIWNKGNLALLDEIVDANYVRQDPSWPEEIRGPEGFKQYVKAMRDSFWGGRFEVHDMLAEADQVAVRWTFSGTHIAEFMGIPATWRQVALTGISIVRIQDGKLAQGWDGYDALSLMHQLGVAP
jgi:steroid delta-isomerase-like uncharacterized protein